MFRVSQYNFFSYQLSVSSNLQTRLALASSVVLLALFVVGEVQSLVSKLVKQNETKDKQGSLLEEEGTLSVEAENCLCHANCECRERMEPILAQTTARPNARLKGILHPMAVIRIYTACERRIYLHF